MQRLYVASYSYMRKRLAQRAACEVGDIENSTHASSILQLLVPPPPSKKKAQEYVQHEALSYWCMCMRP